MFDFTPYGLPRHPTDELFDHNTVKFKSLSSPKGTKLSDATFAEVSRVRKNYDKLVKFFPASDNVVQLVSLIEEVVKDAHALGRTSGVEDGYQSGYDMASSF